MPEPTRIVLPTVHLNGTDKATLLREYHAAYCNLIAFRDSFRAITVNGRDYYPQGPGAFTTAEEQHRQQRDRIGQLMQYLEAHLLHLDS